MTCRYYGITRQSFYVWKRRYDELGEEGLRDRSRRPKTCPNATHVDVVGKILYIRQNYHFGPAKISMYLKRYHDVSISSSGVWRILKRLELNRLPSSQRYKRLDKRWQRYEKQLLAQNALNPRPGELVLPERCERLAFPLLPVVRRAEGFDAGEDFASRERAQRSGRLPARSGAEHLRWVGSPALEDRAALRAGMLSHAKNGSRGV